MIVCGFGCCPSGIIGLSLFLAALSGFSLLFLFLPGGQAVPQGQP